MRKQTQLLYQLQEFDNLMDDRYKEGLPDPDAGQKLSAKQEEFHHEREEIVTKIKSRFVRYYQRLRKSNIGESAVVLLSSNYACQGCFMQVTKSQLSETP